MLEEGISYPAWGDRAIGRIVIGSTLWFLWFLLLPIVLVYGYGMRAMRETGNGVDTPPQWRNWMDLLVDGFRAIVVSFVYALVPNVIAGLVFAAFFFLVAGGGAAGGQEGGILAGLGFLTLLVGGALVLFVELIVLYLLPAALVNAAVEQSIAAGFATDAISRLVFDVRYVTALVHLVVIWLVTLVVASVASVTVILLPAVIFWGGLTSARVLGLVYRSVMATRVPADSTPSSEVHSTSSSPTESNGISE
jgi:hypothetical protein